MIKNSDNMKVILWDFDGVLMNSNAVRDLGFEKVLQEFEPEQIDTLLDFHKTNGGLSRYVKFRYFFEEILQQEVSEEVVLEYANRFSVIMKELLVNPSLLIDETLQFVKANFDKYPMHIVSGSDGNELRYLCQNMGIDPYFVSIEGSPTPKNHLVADLLKRHNYEVTECVLIGDSINDYEAAQFNNISFMSYNNPKLDIYSDIKLF
jgi:phosphoglycolate phosphatase-like HAD superfamily hydrolase